MLFASAANAQDAVTKLHAHVFKGSLLSVTLKKRLDGLAKPLKLKPSTTVPPTISENIPQEQKGDKGHKGGILQVAPNRASRLIVRNLPWNITEQDLRSVFLPFGPIHSIHIPTSSVESETKPDNSGGPSKPRAKGYAFVWMLSKKDAEHAIEGVNGTKISAGIADALVRDKQKKKKLRREEAKLKEREKVRKSRQKGNEIEGDEKQEAEDNGKVEEGSDEEDSPRDAAERIIAVDWALSKDKWEEAKAKMQEDGQGSDNEEDNQETDEGSGSETDGGDLGIHEAGSESGSDSVQDTGMEVDDDSLQSGKPQLPPPESGTTLFVRNVPFEATEDELRTL